MAKREQPPCSPSAKRFVEAHLSKPGEITEKADVSYTVYVSTSEAERIKKVQDTAGTPRQAVLRMLIQSGLEQVESLWKGPSQ